MTTGLWIALDHVVAPLSVAAWFAAGATLALRRARPALAVLVAAVLVTLVRVVTVAPAGCAGRSHVETGDPRLS
ncbi:hypothetical protein [Microbispora siamensis]|uniref:Uncharacterized protein n=1 Tax=Microbispora siamensis TaxID=564413 RepID=A0ABQ4GEE1_9ACTN|nr:hypothetical protein [Microbispora siamensis]GIH59802.1 hypothetical protein Msi02_06190 [Microbispora siamensis]